MTAKILMLVTNHDQINAERKTGLWYEEFAEPYRIFSEQGYAITVASPKGGAAPIDPNSLPESPNTEFLAQIEQTVPLHQVNPQDYDGLFLPGGHGTMFDMPAQEVGTIVGQFADLDLVIGAVCHGPAGLVSAYRADGTPVVRGFRLTSFTNAEEDAAQLTQDMPFLLQTKLEELGAHFEGADNFTDHVVVDRNLVTGQNPQSSVNTALAMVGVLNRQHQSA